MQISYRGKNVEITPALRQHIERKIGKIERFFDQPLSAQVTCAVERGRHIVEVTIPVNSMILRGEERSGDMYASVDLIVDKLERQLQRYKSRFARKPRPERGSAAERTAAPADGAAGGEPAGDREPEIVKTKRFPIKPMDPEDAVMQMNLVGHDFFVFLNAATDEVNVVYRRKDGNYGLIEPSR